MNEAHKGEIFGRLSEAIFVLNLARKSYQRLWNEGRTRMTPAEIERVKTGLAAIGDLQLDIAVTNNNFMKIAIERIQLESIPVAPEPEDGIESEEEEEEEAELIAPEDHAEN